MRYSNTRQFISFAFGFFVICYLAFCFICADFDFRNWDIFARVMCLVCWVLFAPLIMFFMEDW